MERQRERGGRKRRWREEEREEGGRRKEREKEGGGLREREHLLSDIIIFLNINRHLSQHQLSILYDT